MSKLSNIAIVGAAALIAQPTMAQLRHDVMPSAVTARGAEVRASVRIAIGSRDQMRHEARPLQLDLVAGPSLRVSDGRPFERTDMLRGEALRFSLAPGHSGRVSLMGQPVYTRYANASIAAAADGAEDRGISGWAIAGGALLVGLGVAYLALEDAIDCTENGEYICE